MVQLFLKETATFVFGLRLVVDNSKLADSGRRRVAGSAMSLRNSLGNNDNVRLAGNLLVVAP